MGVSVGLIVVALIALLIAVKVAKAFVKVALLVVAVVLAVGAWQTYGRAATPAPAAPHSTATDSPVSAQR